MAKKSESNNSFDGNKPSMTERPNRPVTEKKRSIGQLTVDIDCSEALKGLKAITREAKKATEALKQLEEQQKKMKVDWYEVGGEPVHIPAGIVIDGINDKLTLAVKQMRVDQR